MRQKSETVVFGEISEFLEKAHRNGFLKFKNKTDTFFGLKELRDCLQTILNLKIKFDTLEDVLVGYEKVFGITLRGTKLNFSLITQEWLTCLSRLREIHGVLGLAKLYHPIPREKDFLSQEILTIIDN